MELHGVQTAFPLIGGALAAIGGILTFINGRLNEAKSPEARRSVISITWSVFYVAVTGLGVFASLNGAIFAATSLLGAGIIFQSILFLTSQSPMSRLDILAILCSFLIFGIGYVMATLVSVAGFTTTTTDLLHQMVTLISKDTEAIQSLTRVVHHMTSGLTHQPPASH